MMKTTIKTLVAALAAVALTGCSQEEASVDTNKHPLELLATIAKQGTRASTTLQTDKVDESVTLGVFATDASGNTIGANVPYIYNSGSGKWVKKDDASSSIYFPMDGSPINITVYAPYDKQITTADDILTTFTPKADQTQDADYLASDLIKGTKTNVSYTDAAVDVSMQHLMSKITVVLKAGAWCKLDDFVGVNIRIGNVKTSMEKEGILEDEGLAKASFIVAPKTYDASSEFIQIYFDTGFDYSYTSAVNISIEAGKEYTYSFTLNDAQLTLNNTTITDWTAADPGDSNSTMMPGDE